MRPRFVVLLLLLTAALVPAFGAATTTPATADCAAPMLDLTPRQALPRTGELTVTGRYFKDGCNDTGSCTGALGCHHCDYGPPAQPLKQLTLQLHQRGHSWPLGTTDAHGDLGKATWHVTLPAGVRRGPARLTVDGASAQPAPSTIR